MGDTLPHIKEAKPLGWKVSMALTDATSFAASPSIPPKLRTFLLERVAAGVMHTIQLETTTGVVSYKTSCVYVWRQSELIMVSLNVSPAQGWTDGHHPLCLTVAVREVNNLTIDTRLTQPKPFLPFKPERLMDPAVAKTFTALMQQATPKLVTITDPRQALEALTAEMHEALTEVARKA